MPDIINVVKDDRMVLLLKIVLCRGSEYFSNLLAVSSQVRIIYGLVIIASF